MDFLKVLKSVHIFCMLCVTSSLEMHLLFIKYKIKVGFRIHAAWSFLNFGLKLDIIYETIIYNDPTKP